MVQVTEITKALVVIVALFMSINSGFSKIIRNGIALSSESVGKTVHKIQHKLHLQKGIIVVEWIDEKLWVGYQCNTCGNISGMEPAANLLGPER